MRSPEEQALLTDLQDQVIEMLVRQDEARSRRDAGEVASIQEEIDRLTRQCELLRRAAYIV